MKNRRCVRNIDDLYDECPYTHCLESTVKILLYIWPTTYPSIHSSIHPFIYPCFHPSLPPSFFLLMYFKLNCRHGYILPQTLQCAHHELGLNFCSRSFTLGWIYTGWNAQILSTPLTFWHMHIPVKPKPLPKHRTFPSLQKILSFPISLVTPCLLFTRGNQCPDLFSL